MKKITLAIIVLFYLIPSVGLMAQSVLREIPLQQQIEKSSLIVEGKVIAKKSYWDDNHHNIYTANTVEIYKVFKGEQLRTIEVITLGGTVGNKALVVSPSLKLRKGDVGVFTLYDNNILLKSEAKLSTRKYRTYSSLQGFYRYNLYDNIVVNPFNKKRGISNSFYNEIMNYTKTSFIEISKFKAASNSNTNQAKGFLPPASITFTPITSTAGTQSVLTISGSGFGSTKGKVGFSNADDGGATFVDAIGTQVLTWSDTEITVEIPSQAGTGTIRVTHDDTTTGTSAATLTITYAQQNAVSDFFSVGGATDYAYETRHVDKNAGGGYTWEMHTSFFDDSEKPGAKAAFESALDKWRCESKVNWDVSGSATTVDVAANDGTNIVRFDNGSELGAVTLGVCSSWWSSCGALNNPSSAIWHVEELDIVFDDATDWHFGADLPALTEYDFESVALHELGHGHQLGHVIDVTTDGDNMDDVMHYAISNSEQQRVLTANNIACANDVQSRSNSINACSEDVMVDSSICNLSIEEDELFANIQLYPNPNNGQFTIQKAPFINLINAKVYDIGGRLISEHNLTNTSRIKTIDVSGASKGIYFVNIHSDLASIIKKIILE